MVCISRGSLSQEALFRNHEVGDLNIKYQVRILMVLVTIEVLEVVEGMVIILPRTNDDARIYLTVEVLEAVKSWSNLMLNHPLEMVSSGDLSNFGYMKMGVVD